MSIRMAALAAVALACLSACTISGPASQGSPPPPQIHASALKCAGDDHSLDDAQLGWGFCYPATWRYREREQRVPAPSGVDVTFDVTDVSAHTAETGKFGFMIISTYDRGQASSLSQWASQNAPADGEVQSIAWANSAEAGISKAGTRYALTQHHVVVLDIRAGAGNLDLEKLMSDRLSTWRFVY